MSAQALVETIALELRQAAAEGADRVVLTPGNYGADFLAESGLIPSDIGIVKCSNFIGEALDRAAEAGIRQLILVGHLGKLVKVAGGVMNTHSRWADCRMEILCAHAACAGPARETARALMGSATTDAGLDILAEAGLLDRTMDSLLSALQAHLERRAGTSCRCGGVLFTNTRGLLGMTGTAKEILNIWRAKRGTFLRRRERWDPGPGTDDPEGGAGAGGLSRPGCPRTPAGDSWPGDRPGGCGSD